LKTESSPSSFAAIRSAFQKNDLKAAHSLCLAYLDSDPTYQPALDLLQVIVQRRLFAVTHRDLIPKLKDIEQLIAHRSYQLALTQIETLLTEYARIPAILYLRTKALKQGSSLHQLAATYLELIAMLPGASVLHLELANVMQRLHRFDDARQHYTACLHYDPKNLAAISNLGVALGRLGDFARARQHFERALDMRPDHALTLNNYGKLLFDYGDVEAAKRMFGRAAALSEGRDHAVLNVAHVAQVMGQVDEATAAYRSLQKSAHHAAEAFFNLAVMHRLQIGESELQRAIDAVVRITEPEADRVHYAFGLSHYFHDRGDYESAFHYLTTGNTLKKQMLNYDASASTQLMQSLTDNASKVLDCDVDDDRFSNESGLIFIIGMPRSGSTLVEHILTCSDRVVSGGEMPWIPQFGRDVAAGNEAISLTHVARFRARVLEKNTARGLSAPRIIDKLPANFKYLALILKAFPTAKIVHIRRDPRAVGWSIFRQLFSGDVQPYGYCLDSIRSYWIAYDRVMRFWDKSPIAKRIHHVQYEELVSDPDTVIRQLVEYLELPWTDAFLAPERNMRPVQTASSLQVRSPIGQHVTSDWIAYRDFLPNAFVQTPWSS
jgi:tetratricopeptide (TPR) repeat protein